MPDKKVFTENNSIMDKSFVPEVIYDENPELVDLYYTAWQSAWEHIFTCPGAPVQTYMNEGIRCHKIWIWDTCFMVQFCRYAADKFPGIQSLDNFYRVIHDGEAMVLKVHHTDNPPLFAWTEYEYLKHTGDLERVKRILLKDQYLQRHYEWMEKLKGGILFDYSTAKTAAEWVPGKGFRWAGCPSGMDNTPRGDDDYTSIYWLELSAQQGLSALYIARLAEAVGEKALAEKWMAKFEEQKKLVNERFWSEKDQMYFDHLVDESGFSPVLTPASIWPMLAEMCDEKQAAALAKVLADPEKLGGKYPIPSVSKDSKYFDPEGEYWRGSIWLPVVYMCVKALGKYGYGELAREISANITGQQLRTFKTFEPHTIWECYSPTADKPATKNKKEGLGLVRTEFCGWSALGPISLLIENLIGIEDVNALTDTIIWNPVSGKASGIKNLKMGSNTISLYAESAEGKAEVECEKGFTLIFRGKEYHIAAGKTVLA